MGAVRGVIEMFMVVLLWINVEMVMHGLWVNVEMIMGRFWVMITSQIHSTTNPPYTATPINT